MPDPMLKVGKPLDFDLKDDGEVLVQFAILGDPKRPQEKDIDKDGDVSLKGSIPTKAVPISAYSHASWPHRGGLLPVGRGSIGEDGTKALFRGRFNLNSGPGRDTYETVKDMAELQEWSHGYTVVKAKSGEWAGKRANIIERFDIHEVSPVLLGAGNDTATLAVKSLGGYDPDDEGGASNLPFAAHADRVLVEVEAFVARSEALKGLRQQENRELGPRAKAQIEDFLGGVERMRESLARANELRSRLQDLIRSDKDGIANEALALEAEFRGLQTNLISLGYDVQA